MKFLGVRKSKEETIIKLWIYCTIFYISLN